MSRRMTLLLALVALNMVSAVAVVESTYQTRLLVYQLQSERLEQDQIASRWAQIQLENSTWGSPDRVARIAQGNIGMVQPHKYVVLGSDP